MIKFSCYFAGTLAAPFAIAVLLGVAAHYTGYEINVDDQYRWFSGFFTGLLSSWVWRNA